MFNLLLIIAVSALALVIGRTIRDVAKKRPVRDKQTRRKPLHLFFAVIAVAVILFVAVFIGIGNNIYNVIDFQSLDILLLSLAVLVFGIYLMFEIVKYIQKLRKH